MVSFLNTLADYATWRSCRFRKYHGASRLRNADSTRPRTFARRLPFGDLTYTSFKAENGDAGEQCGVSGYKYPAFSRRKVVISRNDLISSSTAAIVKLQTNLEVPT